MTIPTPPFILVDECPGWCTFDHDGLQREPGDHATNLVTLMGADSGHSDSIDLYASADDGLEVSVTIEGDEAFRMPVVEAPERLIELARAFLTAAYRLGVIEDAEASVAIGRKQGDVSYSLEFSPDLLPLTPETLRAVQA